MKFTFDRDAMIKEIAIAQEIISTKNAGSILSNVLLTAADNTLTIKAKDMKVNFETQISVQVEVEGSTVVYSDKFMQILTALPEGEIEFDQGAEGDADITVIIKHVDKKIKYRLLSKVSENFPDFKSADEVPYFDVPSKDLKDMISHTSFAVSEDETRAFMNGVYITKEDDNLTFVATDGRRLSYESKSLLAGVENFPAAIVHPKILNIICKHAPEEGNISVAIIDTRIFFKFGSYKFGAALLDGPFPNYKRVIPESQLYSFQVDKVDLVNALRRVAIMVDRKAGRLYFDISSGVLKISSSKMNASSADEEIPCQYDGDDVEIALNYRYLDEPLKVMDGDRVAFDFSGDMKAVTLRPEPASDYFHIIMPMQKE